MVFQRITHNPRVMGGKPCIRGLRITAPTVLKLLAAGYSHERILQSYPELEMKDFNDVLSYAAWRLQEEEHLLPMS